MLSAASMTDERIYPVKEVAKILKVHERTIYRMIASGEIDAFTVRDVYRIRQSAVDAVMRGKKNGINGDEHIGPA